MGCSNQAKKHELGEELNLNHRAMVYRLVLLVFSTMHYWLTLRHWMHRTSVIKDSHLHQTLPMQQYPDLPVDIWTHKWL